MTLLRICFLWLLLLCGQLCSAQAYDKVWLIGSSPTIKETFIGNAIDSAFFSLDTAGVIPISSFADISDTNAHLLFYSNGIQIGNTTSYTMENGDTLSDLAYYSYFAGGGVTVPQTTLILPRSGNTFYLFYFSESDSLFGTTIQDPDRFYYAVVDMDSNAGLGKVLSKKNVAYKGLLGESRLTACRHANGRDWWVVHQGYDNDEYFVYLVTSDSVSAPIIQHIGPSTSIHDNGGAQAIFSPDGSRFATSEAGSELILMNFDRCTGLFSHPDSIGMPQDSIFYNGSLSNSPPSAIGVCFAPGGRYLYATSGISIWQYDTHAADVAGSMTLVGRWDSTGPPNAFYGFYQMYLMPNGQIIIDDFAGGEGTFHTIDSPDVGGVGCHYVFGGFPTSTLNATNLPNMINYRLGALAGSGCDTLTGISPQTPEGGYLQIRPNPAAERTTISLSQYHRDAWLYIYDALGREVYRNEMMYLDDTLDIRSYERGVYMVRLLSADGQLIGRFVKE